MTKIRRISRFRKLIAFCSVPLLAAGVVCMTVFAGMMFSGDLEPALFIVGGALGAPGLVGIMWARWKRRMEDRYRRYLIIAGRAAYVPLRNFVTVTGLEEATVKTDLQSMVDRGYFGPRAFIDASRWALVTDPAAPAPRSYVQPAPQPVRQARPQPQPQSQPAPQPKPAAPKKDEYAALLDALHKTNTGIRDNIMRSRISRIEDVSREIFRAVADKPEKKPQIQMFMNYYLPTTVKLLETYAAFERSAVAGENIEKSRASIESITLTLADAFEKQYDSLFALDVMDISTEIQVMQNMLRRDGLIDGGLKMPSV